MRATGPVTFPATNESLAELTWWLKTAFASDDGTIKLWDGQTWRCLHTLIVERPYERMNISFVEGLSEAQKVALKVLGAVE